MDTGFRTHLAAQLDALRTQNVFKTERVLASPQQPSLTLADGRRVLNMCANNYLGLANSPRLVETAKRALEEWGLGTASVRFICGTMAPHRALEERLAEFLGTEDAILFSSCWDANGGTFETLLSEDDAIVSDSLNHASLIDGIRLCKAKRLRYPSGDMQALEERLIEAKSARFKLVVTDGVFSMDGVIADLGPLVALAQKHQAMVMVDDSHAVGLIGAGGRGTHELRGVMGKVDILTGTFGKALGGAAGGYVASSKEVVALLRQRARPYLFSNALTPAITVATLEALRMVEVGGALRSQLEENARHFRAALQRLGFTLAGAGHPIVPIMLGDAGLAAAFAAQMLDEGVYVIAFSFPVVPQGHARIRTQLSAAHTRAQLDEAIAAFARVGKRLGCIS